MKRRAVIIAPGRGTYNREELGYIGRHHGYDGEFLAAVDDRRRQKQRKPISELDGAKRFSAKLHQDADNAGPLIFCSSFLDWQEIRGFDVVAITGNSMGWYTALGMSDALDPLDAISITEESGRIAREYGAGGQLIYPWMPGDWTADTDARTSLIQTIETINERPDHDLHVSIDLGGMLVLAGSDAGLTAFSDAVPKVEGRYPMALPNHSGFHSPMQQVAAEHASTHFSGLEFRLPTVPLIDGLGRIHWPYHADIEALRSYTFGAQYTATYGFTAAVRTAAREFAPDVFIITGPGTTLGGATAQSLIVSGFQGLKSKADFQVRQQEAPVLLSMGREDQRRACSQDEKEN